MISKITKNRFLYDVYYAAVYNETDPEKLMDLDMIYEEWVKRPDKPEKWRKWPMYLREILNVVIDE